jgi:hypothetical protein
MDIDPNKFVEVRPTSGKDQWCYYGPHRFLVPARGRRYRYSEALPSIEAGVLEMPGLATMELAAGEIDGHSQAGVEKAPREVPDEEKVFVCEKCGKSYANAQWLSRHMKRHAKGVVKENRDA